MLQDHSRAQQLNEENGEGNYENLSVLHPMGPVNFSTLSAASAVRCEQAQGDLIDALCLGMDAGEIRALLSSLVRSILGLGVEVRCKYR